MHAQREPQNQHDSGKLPVHQRQGLRTPFVDNRPLASAHQALVSVAQRASVVQLATRLSAPVLFNGGAFRLLQLIQQWGPPNGTHVQVIPTDNVGGSYRVRFSNQNGPAISLQTANQWVQAGIAHADDNDASSDEGSSSDSDTSSSDDDH